MRLSRYNGWPRPAERLGIVLSWSLLAVVGHGTAAAQSRELPGVTAMRSSAAPAFLLLGVSPEAVARPNSPADVAAQAFSHATGLISVPQDLAVEFAPYWLVNRPTLSWREDTIRSIWTSVQRTARISLGSASIGTDAEPVTGLAGGLSVDLISGRIPPEIRDTLRALESSAAAQGTIFQQRRMRELDRLDAMLVQELQLAHDTARTTEGFQQAAARLAAAYEPKRAAVDSVIRADPEYQRQIEEARQRFEGVAMIRRGFFWNVAGGASWSFPGQSWDRGEFWRYGAWTTLSHEGLDISRDLRFTPLAVARFLTATDESLPDLLDIGARLIASAPTYAVSVEYVVRKAFSGDDVPDIDHRLVGIFEYRVGSNTWLQASFGKGHETDSNRDLVAQFGITVSLARDRYEFE